MKISLIHNISFLLAILLSPATFSQDVRWEKSYGGDNAEYLFDAIPSADYGFILAGSSASGKTGNKTQINQGDLDYWVWKMDEHGELDWQKSFGGSGMDMLRSIRTTLDGGFILAGSSDSPKGQDKKEDSRGEKDYWIIKLDAGGGEQWQKTIGGVSGDDLVAIEPTKDGGYLLGGSSESDVKYSKDNDIIGEKHENSRGSLDYWIIKLDAKGTIIWQKTYGGQFADNLRCLSITSDGGAIIGGYSNSPISGDKTAQGFGLGDYWIIKINKDGLIEWQKCFGGEADDQLFSIIQTEDGDYIAGGNSFSSASGNKTSSCRNGSDFWIVKMDPDGNSLWQQSYDFGKADILTSIIENKDGTLLIGGYARSEMEGKSGKEKESINDYIAIKTDSNGGVLWDKSIGSEGDDVLRKLIETRDGGYLLAGTSNPVAHRHSDSKENKGNKSNLIVGSDENVAGVQKLQDQIGKQKEEGLDTVNDFYNEQVTEVTETIHDNIPLDKNSPMKFSTNAPSDLVQDGNNSKALDMGNLIGGSHKSKIPASRSKSNNLGNNDFWVIKLKDRDKEEKVKTNLEAIPNPSRDYTNVIVGYDFQYGTVTIFDLSGRQLNSFKISSDRTIPVNLSQYPEGIYVINVKTNKGDGSVKVMRSGS
ncbi:T9SS type A sorting domain-containing protein [Flavobacterium silvaticum]|uniref:T9SS type A sorting domain-containing protein n=1 Tax=Flavobacterium silvaticum TaxID=1852020 RepID=A0A972JGS2_9FLAO|nr:T9SS type A sorting domain-containing protein [Flavobacterium silvaticum]NMH28496.1 T9SS type A sorting domain-containing protein [Flavobacterium silvaticum]